MQYATKVPDYEVLTVREQKYLKANPLHDCRGCGASVEMCKYTITTPKLFIICPRCFSAHSLSVVYSTVEDAVAGWNA